MTYTPSESLIPTASSFYELPRAHHRRASRSGHGTRPPPRTDSVQIHLRPHRHVPVHPLDVLVGHADAAVRRRGADRLLEWGAVDLVAIAQLEPVVSQLALDRPVLRPFRRDEERVVEHDVLVEHERNEPRLSRLDDAYFITTRRESRTVAQSDDLAALEVPEREPVLGGDLDIVPVGWVPGRLGVFREHGAHAARRLESPRLATVMQRRVAGGRDGRAAQGVAAVNDV